MRRTLRSRPESADAARQRALTYRIAALLLDHPDGELLGKLPQLRIAVATLPEPARGQLTRLLDHLCNTPRCSWPLTTWRPSICDAAAACT